MTFKMSDTPQTIKIFNLRSDTNEFIGAGDAYIPPHTGLPANCTDIAPPDIPASHIAIFDAETGTWSLHEDHRGETVYDTTTGNQVYISAPGPLPENVTSVSPDGEYQKWDGKAWVKDEAAETAARLREAEGTKSRLLQMASEKIAPLQDAVDLDEATDKEKASLLAWRKYRVQVNRVDTLKPVKSFSSGMEKVPGTGKPC
ncbi:tail fiber assembly protein [Salmonella enterica]|nr:tail fiber assembly protein [Salmonella enterica]